MFATVHVLTPFRYPIRRVDGYVFNSKGVNNSAVDCVILLTNKLSIKDASKGVIPLMV